MAELLQFVFSGLTVGAIYALVALGFTLIYKASDIINFAQGEFVMLGGMTTVFVAHAGVPLAACRTHRYHSHNRHRPGLASFCDRACAWGNLGRLDHDNNRRLDISARHRPDRF